ncbi:hypothetical protein AURANDRAFT_68153 [Aureococcus anophagefferens]|uniref:Uncharacterized protein n=1 Tax=Aureococcus anophagefferens TaxID=44056 RepID=F0YNN7_AURAN|nr:hypothetical protein AURANDRAFT_68153 [Aureococcus anophagefferens]EGB03264.1 hypothetical protein AURANDRAFT_68153 [Aureococcus anophagefferens]|eukprot:XP_009042025.1 hypothetical protein AURANDRAFT_68153 [Aureococcus anophagefferens]
MFGHLREKFREVAKHPKGMLAAGNIVREPGPVDEKVATALATYDAAVVSSVAVDKGCHAAWAEVAAASEAFVDAAGLLRLLALTDDLARPGAAPTDDLGAAVLRLRRCASACAGAVRRQPPEPLDGVGATCRTFNASEPAVRRAEKAYREACAEKRYYDGRIMELDGAAPADKKQRRREKHLRAVEGLDAAEQALAAALGAARARAGAVVDAAAPLDAAVERIAAALREALAAAAAGGGDDDDGDDDARDDDDDDGGPGRASLAERVKRTTKGLRRELTRLKVAAKHRDLGARGDGVRVTPRLETCVETWAALKDAAPRVVERVGDAQRALRRLADALGAAAGGVAAVAAALAKAEDHKENFGLGPGPAAAWPAKPAARALGLAARARAAADALDGAGLGDLLSSDRAAALDAGLEQRVSLAVEVGHYDGKTASLEGAADGDRVARNAEKRETAARLLEEHDHRLDEAFCAYDEVRVAVNARAAAALLGALDALWGGASGGAAPPMSRWLVVAAAANALTVDEIGVCFVRNYVHYDASRGDHGLRLAEFYDLQAVAMTLRRLPLSPRTCLFTEAPARAVAAAMVALGTPELDAPRLFDVVLEPSKPPFGGLGGRWPAIAAALGRLGAINASHGIDKGTRLLSRLSRLHDYARAPFEVTLFADDDAASWAASRR